MITSNQLLKFPINYFSVSMGLLGLSIEISHFSKFLGLNLVLSYSVTLFAWLVLGISIVLFSHAMLTRSNRLLLIAKWRHSQGIVDFSILSLMVMLALISISSYLTIELMSVLFFIAVFFHTLLNLMVIRRWITDPFLVFKNLRPSIFLMLSSDFVVVIAGKLFVPHEISEFLWFYFSISIVLWFVFLFFIIYRLMFSTHFPDRWRPGIFMLLSPPSLAFVAYQTLTGDPTPGVFSTILMDFSIFIFVFLIAQYGYFKQASLSMLSWAFVYPVASFGISLQMLYKLTGHEGYLMFAYLVLVGNLFFTLYLFSRMLLDLFKKQSTAS